MSEEPIERPLDEALRRWRVEEPRDLWPGIEARLERADDPMALLLDEVRALRGELTALRGEVGALRRAVIGRSMASAPVRLPEPDWIGKERG